jgi:N-acetyl-anhydromuramyl-L-alanine amidase AmpD
MGTSRFIVLALGGSFVVAGGLQAEEKGPQIAERLARRGDEIVVCGQLYHTTAPVVLWLDPGGYDAYRLERRYVPIEEAATPPAQKQGRPPASRYSIRRKGLTEAELKRVRGGGWDLPLLRRVVDQFVIHFDARGTSRRCFEVLHDVRGLSVHFLLDLDGTIYQTLDLKEQAWHATIANGRSIGVEIANIGAYPPAASSLLDRWYQIGAGGQTTIVIADHSDRAAIRDQTSVFHPARPAPVTGVIQGQTLRQFDFTLPQYDSLIRLTATLCTLFPEIRCDYPRGRSGALVTAKLPDADLTQYHGLLGHYHVQTNKVDPGPAFQWDRLIEGSRALLAGKRN